VNAKDAFGQTPLMLAAQQLAIIYINNQKTSKKAKGQKPLAFLRPLPHSNSQKPPSNSQKNQKPPKPPGNSQPQQKNKKHIPFLHRNK